MKLSTALSVFEILQERSEITIKQSYDYLQSEDARLVQTKIKRTVLPHGQRKSPCEHARERSRIYCTWFFLYTQEITVYQTVVWFQHAIFCKGIRNATPKQKTLITSHEHKVLQEKQRVFKNLPPGKVNIVKYDNLRNCPEHIYIFLAV